jgi:hypothetical protein
VADTDDAREGLSARRGAGRSQSTRKPHDKRRAARGRHHWRLAGGLRGQAEAGISPGHGTVCMRLTSSAKRQAMPCRISQQQERVQAK